MKISIIQGAFLPVPPVLGGAVEKMWYALAHEFVRRGNEIVYISRTFEGMQVEERKEGIHHKRVSGYNTPASIVQLKVLDLLYTIRALQEVPPDSDIVVTNTFWAPVLLSSRLKKRCFVDVQRMPKGQMRFYNKAGRLRANSTPVVSAICNELPKEQHSRVVFVPNPLPFQDLPQVNPAEKKPVLLYVGRVHPEKGLQLLIKAFKKLEGTWKLKIVGPWETSAGGGGTAYLKVLKELAAGHAIEFCGPVNDITCLNRYYAEASVFIYPSLAEKGETFGLAPLEAMAWGCVPVVSNLACFQDFICPGKNGLVFDHRSTNAADYLRDAIEKLIKDADLREELAFKSLLVRESHSVSFIASKFLQEFEEQAGQQLLHKQVSV